MRLGIATLCDAATIREGLIHVLGGSPSVIQRPNFPAPLGANLAVQFWLTRDELAQSHSVTVELRKRGSTDGFAPFRAKFDFGPVETPEMPDEVPDVAVPVVLPSGSTVLAEPGAYDVTITADDEELARIPVYVLHGQGDVPSPVASPIAGE